MRPFCPCRCTRRRSTPSSRANLRTEGLACARAKLASLIGRRRGARRRRRSPRGCRRRAAAQLAVSRRGGAGARRAAARRRGALASRRRRGARRRSPLAPAALAAVAGGRRRQLQRRDQAAGRHARALARRAASRSRRRPARARPSSPSRSRASAAACRPATLSPGLHQHVDDGHVLEVAQIGHVNFFRSQGGSLQRQLLSGSALSGSMPSFCDRRRSRVLRSMRSGIGQRLERRQRDEVAIDLEVPAQRRARIAAPEAVGAERHVGAATPTAGSGRARCARSRSRRPAGPRARASSVRT